MENNSANHDVLLERVSNLTATVTGIGEDLKALIARMDTVVKIEANVTNMINQINDLQTRLGRKADELNAIRDRLSEIEKVQAANAVTVSMNSRLRNAVYAAGGGFAMFLIQYLFQLMGGS